MSKVKRIDFEIDLLAKHLGYESLEDAIDDGRKPLFDAIVESGIIDNPEELVDPKKELKKNRNKKFIEDKNRALNEINTLKIVLREVLDAKLAIENASIWEGVRFVRDARRYPNPTFGPLKLTIHIQELDKMAKFIEGVKYE